MEFGILGPLRVVQDGETLDLGGPRPRAVLARLILADGEAVTTDMLVDDVWAGRPPPSATKTLQKYVSELRKVIGRSVLRTVGSGYTIEIGGDELDASRFERLLEKGEFERALSLWRGDVLGDLPDAGFAGPERARLNELRLVALEGKLRGDVTRGRHAEVVAELDRVVAEQPLRERLVGLHMLALYRSGRQVEALRAFDRHRRRMREDVGLSPAAELKELEAAILRQDSALASDAAPSAGSGVTADPRAAVTRPGPSEVRLPNAALLHCDRPFVGRDVALAALDETWDAALAGTKRVTLITGEAGIGKTRLAATFATAAHGAGAVVLWGRATSGPTVPYEPIVTALTTVLSSLTPDTRRRLVEGRPALGVLVPGLTNRAAGAPTERLDLDVERYVVFETVAELLERESAGWPVLLVIDDLQWADELSLRMIDHVVRHDRAARLLVVATLRDLPAVHTPVLDRYLADLQRDDVLTRVSLTGLDVASVSELLAASGWRDADCEAGEIHRATAGNPFFVTELADCGGRGSSLEVPPSLREVLNARLRRLDRRTARLVDVAAVAGRTLPLTAIAAAAGLPVDELLDAVDAAIAAGVLTEEAPSGGLAFKHALVQQAALDRLSHARRAALHLELADGLADVDPPPWSDVAHHLLASGGLAPRQRMVEASVRAGDDALAVIAYEEAGRWAERAVAAAGPDRDRLACEARLLLSHARRTLGFRAEARDAAMYAAALARESSDGELLARAAEAAALARAGLGFGTGTDDPELESLLDEARARLQVRAAASGATSRSAEISGYPALAATAQLTWRLAHGRRDLLRERLDADCAALDYAERARNPHLELNALLYGISDMTEAGDVESAARWFERFHRRAAEVRQPVYESFARSMEATAHLMRGNYDASSRLADEALEIGRSTHGTNALEAWLGNRLVCAWDHGRLAEFSDVVSTAVAEYGNHSTWSIFEAFCLVAAHRVDRARLLLDQIAQHGRVDVVDDSLWAAGIAILVEIARALDDRRVGRMLANATRPYADRIVICGLARATLGPMARYAGIAAHLEGDLDTADELLARAEQRCRVLAARPHLARTLHDRARLLSERGNASDADAATLARAEAQEIAQDLGVSLRALVSPGAGRPPSSPAAPQSPLRPIP
jgi:DNA-binding SARP family transcriptional activator